MAQFIQSFITLQNMNTTLTRLSSTSRDDNDDTALIDVAATLSAVAGLVVYSIKDESKDISHVHKIDSGSPTDGIPAALALGADSNKICDNPSSSQSTVQQQQQLDKSMPQKDILAALQEELKSTKLHLAQALSEIDTLNSRLRLSKNISVSTKVQLDEGYYE